MLFFRPINISSEDNMKILKWFGYKFAKDVYGYHLIKLIPAVSPKDVVKILDKIDPSEFKQDEKFTGLIRGPEYSWPHQ